MAEVEFEGQKFELRTGQMNQLVMTEFFAATAELDGEAQIPNDVMLALLKECIAPKDYRRFMRLGRETDDFWNKTATILEARMNLVAGEHPTGLPSDSSDGPADTALKSVPSSDAKVLELAHGRVDRMAMLREAQEAAKARAS